MIHDGLSPSPEEDDDRILKEVMMDTTPSPEATDERILDWVDNNAKV